MARDYSQLSDAELDRMLAEKQKYGKPLDEMSDQELDAALATKQKSQREPFTGEGLVRGTLRALPLAGGMAGGILGGMGTIGVGAMPGAAIGGALGKSIQTFGEGLLGDEKTREEVYLEPIKSGAEMAAGEGIGKLAGKAWGGLLAAKQKPNSQAIAAAAEKLGGKATPGMMSAEPEIQMLESSLYQSPTIAGAGVRSRIGAVHGPMTKAAERLTKGATGLERGEVGDIVKSGITAKIGERLAPAKMAYESMAGDFKAIPIGAKSLERVSNNILGHDFAKFSTGGGRQLAAGIANDLKAVQSLDDLRRLKTYVGKSIEGYTGPERQLVSDAYGKLKRLESNSIMRSAIESARTPNEGAKIAKNMVSELKSANKEYGSLMQDIGETARRGGLGKARSITKFLDKLEKTPSEAISGKLFKTQDYESLKFMQEKFPEEFDILKSLKLKEIQAQSRVGEKTSISKFLKSVEGLDSRTQKLVLGEDAPETIRNLRTLQNAIPEKIGPSGTPQGIEVGSYLGAGHWFNELKRAAQFAKYSSSEAWQGLENANAVDLVGFPTGRGLVRMGERAAGGLLGVKNER